MSIPHRCKYCLASVKGTSDMLIPHSRNRDRGRSPKTILVPRRDYLALRSHCNARRSSTSQTVLCTGHPDVCSRPLSQGRAYKDGKLEGWYSAHTGICHLKEALPFREPLPCNPAAETALRPLSWCSERLTSHQSPSPEKVCFTDTGMASEG